MTTRHRSSRKRSIADPPSVAVPGGHPPRPSSSPSPRTDTPSGSASRANRSRSPRRPPNRPHAARNRELPARRARQRLLRPARQGPTTASPRRRTPRAGGQGQHHHPGAAAPAGGSRRRRPSGGSTSATTPAAPSASPRTGGRSSRPPVLFRRTALTAPLPTPQRGGDLDELWAAAQRHPPGPCLLAGVLVASLEPDISHPVIDLDGEQGTGKTTAGKTIVSVLDPSTPPGTPVPQGPRAMDHRGRRVLVGRPGQPVRVPDWLSDALCRASTGDGDVRRKLYSDGGLYVVRFRGASSSTASTSVSSATTSPTGS
jgi:hypothetical protein